MRPTEELQQHHDVEAPLVDETHFRPAWRVRSKLELLLEQVAITREIWLSATEFRAIWTRAYASALPSRSFDAPSSRRGSREPPIWRLDALTKLRVLKATIGQTDYRLAEYVIIDDPSWAMLGRLFSIDPNTARTRVVAALESLNRGLTN